MKQIYLGLAMHNHQPVGNFPWVFDEVFNKAYLPMVQALERHPAVKLSLHYSGPLIDWLIEQHPEFLERVAGLVKRGQVEVMSGGYYEPILPIIPDSDKLGQIAKLSQTVRERFGQQPSGLWLAERVWEPHLPQSLAQAGIKWTLVDDTHFKLVGLDDKDLFGYYLTEEQGHVVKLFPSSKKLRYIIPWLSVAEVIAYLGQQASEDNYGG
jgi:alpha-amylase/alpha-mannosidase (GH57 family)